MGNHLVSLVRYREPYGSVKEAVELCKGLRDISSNTKVFMKPNIVFWTKAVSFPKWGVITTSRVVQDMVVLLKEHGVEHITIGEGPVTHRPGDTDTVHHAFDYLGYNKLEKRYGVKVVNIFERPFKKVEVDEGIFLNFNKDILESDFVVNLPVLKTHAQTIVSLGIKNLKGTININSRKKCHSPDPQRDLHFMIGLLPKEMPPMLTLIDGIYTNERGPSFDGKPRRSDILVASGDLVSADKVGAKILGYDPSNIPHLVHVCRRYERSLGLDDIKIVGERVDQLARPHHYSFPYNKSDTLPLPMERMGIKGLSYPKYDSTLCTYCSGLNGVVLYAISKAWKGVPWDEVEILTGKTMKPTPGMKKTILLGKCMYLANRNDPNISEMIPVKGCPPEAQDVVRALHKAGIMVDPLIFEQIESAPGAFMAKYQGKPQYNEGLFRIQ